MGWPRFAEGGSGGCISLGTDQEPKMAQAVKKNTWAAETGATLRDLMDRMGHATTRAAMIYLHKTAGRDGKIADGLGRLIEQSGNADRPADDGTPTEGTDGQADPEGHAAGTADE
jgi:hypothetical protein